MAKDLSRVVPTQFPSGEPIKQPSWRDLESYDPSVLSAAAGRGITGTLEGTRQLAGSARDYLTGLMQTIREKSPIELQGTAPAQSKETFDAVNQALAEAGNDPLQAAKNLASGVVNVGKEAIKNPASMTEFIASNLTPGRRTRTRVEASRPEGKGLVISDVADESGRPIGMVDRYIQDAQYRVSAARQQDLINDEQSDAIKKFFETKAKNYFLRQFGTPKDPVFKAIKEGKLTNIQLAKDFPNYALDQLAVGKERIDPLTGQKQFFPKYPRLSEDLARKYDELAEVDTYVFNLNDPTAVDPRYNALSETGRSRQSLLGERQIDEMMAQGLSAGEANVNLKYAVPTAEGKLPGIYASAPAALYKQYQRNELPKQVAMAIEKGEPIYNISPSGSLRYALDEVALVRYLGTLPPNKINNLRFEDALKESAKYNKQFLEREALINDIRTGRRVPDRVFAEGVSAPLLSFGEDSPRAGFAWKKINDAESTAPEGAYIGHSVGGYAKGGSYGPSKHKEFVSGDVSIYTLRDNRNRPVTTVEVQNTERGPVVSQVKGNGRATGNTAPVDYEPEVYQFLTEVIKPILIRESDMYLPPSLQQYKIALALAPTTR
jgi:hypothetical protein